MIHAVSAVIGWQHAIVQSGKEKQSGGAAIHFVFLLKRLTSR